MAAFALANMTSPATPGSALYLSIGIMIPIRLGTVGILRLMVESQAGQHASGVDPGLHGPGFAVDHLYPAAVYAPGASELKDAARIDGASEYRIFWLVLPLVAPLGAIGIFTMIPIWNDLWFPLIIAPSSKTATVTLGVQQFLGQFVSTGTPCSPR